MKWLFYEQMRTNEAMKKLLKTYGSEGLKRKVFKKKIGRIIYKDQFIKEILKEKIDDRNT